MIPKTISTDLGKIMLDTERDLSLSKQKEKTINLTQKQVPQRKARDEKQLRDINNKNKEIDERE